MHMILTRRFKCWTNVVVVLIALITHSHTHSHTGLDTILRLLGDKEEFVNKIQVYEYGVMYLPLFMAVKEGHGDVVKMLIQYGADVEIVSSSDNMTALHFAAIYGHVEVAEVGLSLSLSLYVFICSTGIILNNNNNNTDIDSERC